MRYMFDSEHGFTTEDVQGIELGNRVMEAGYWENGGTAYDRDTAQIAIATNAAVAEARAYEEYGLLDGHRGPEPGTSEWYYEQQGYDPEPDWSTDPAVDSRNGLLYYGDGQVTRYDGTVIHEEEKEAGLWTTDIWAK